MAQKCGEVYLIEELFLADAGVATVYFQNRATANFIVEFLNTNISYEH